MIKKPEIKSKEFIKASEIINKEFIVNDFEFGEHEKFGKFVRFNIRIPSDNKEGIFSTFSNVIYRQIDGVKKSDIIGHKFILRMEYNALYIEEVE